MGRAGEANGGGWLLVSNLVSKYRGNSASKAQYILPWRSYCPGRSRKRSGSAGAWTVPPGGLRYYQLALPNEDRGDDRADPHAAAVGRTHALARGVIIDRANFWRGPPQLAA